MVAVGDILETAIQEIQASRAENTTRQISSDQDGKTNDRCPICDGTGWESKYDEDGREYCVKCNCGILNNLAGRKSVSNIPKKYQSSRLSQFSLDIYVQQESKDIIEFSYSCIQCWLRDLNEMRSRGMGLYLFSGTPGSGKTLMAACVANELMHEYDMSVRFYTSMDILEEITKTWNKLSDLLESNLLQKFREVDVLVIDDFGVEGTKDWINDKFYQIINSRYESKKITIFTSNMSVDDLQRDIRIKNRIKERTYQLPFPEESVRENIYHSNMDDMMQRVKNFRKEKGGQLSLPL